MKESELEAGHYYERTYRDGSRAVRRIVRMPIPFVYPRNVVWEGVVGTGHATGECHINTFRHWAKRDVTDEFRKKEGAA